MTAKPLILSEATFSPCGRYRYDLTRVWEEPKPVLVAVMLNPSAADAKQDDPTVRRVIQFAQDWGCGSLVVFNLFAFRATDPAEMMAQADPIGPENDMRIASAIVSSMVHGFPVLAAWGAHGGYRGRAFNVLRLVDGVKWTCLGKTSDGHPRHPLYVPRNTKPEPLEVAT